jgi:hypothetical protein
MYNIVFFVFYFSISVLILLISYFIPFLFKQVFIFLNLVIQLQFLICLVFHFGPLFLIFLILSLALLLIFFFNFILQSNFLLLLLLLFYFNPYFFIFHFIKSIFASIKPSN